MLETTPKIPKKFCKRPWRTSKIFWNARYWQKLHNFGLLKWVLFFLPYSLLFLACTVLTSSREGRKREKRTGTGCLIRRQQFQQMDRVPRDTENAPKGQRVYWLRLKSLFLPLKYIVLRKCGLVWFGFITGSWEKKKFKSKIHFKSNYLTAWL